MGEHVQYGIVAGCHIEDYEEGHIKIHEKTRRLKEEDRIRYVDTQNANTGPVFLAYRDSAVIQAEVDRVKQTQPLYHFTASDGVEHTVWRFEETASIEEGFAAISALYVADGHHRSASLQRWVQNAGRRIQRIPVMSLIIIFYRFSFQRVNLTFSHTIGWYSHYPIR